MHVAETRISSEPSSQLRRAQPCARSQLVRFASPRLTLPSLPSQIPCHGPLLLSRPRPAQLDVLSGCSGHPATQLFRSLGKGRGHPCLIAFFATRLTRLSFIPAPSFLFYLNVVVFVALQPDFASLRERILRRSRGRLQSLFGYSSQLARSLSSSRRQSGTHRQAGKRLVRSAADVAAPGRTVNLDTMRRNGGCSRLSRLSLGAVATLGLWTSSVQAYQVLVTESDEVRRPSRLFLPHLQAVFLR